MHFLLLTQKFKTMAKYSKGSGEEVKEAMHEMKEGKLKSGRSGKKVTSRKQAIAIGLSEAREKGEKVPSKKSASKKGGAKKSAAKKSSTKKSAAKKGSTKKSSTKKSSTKKSSAKKSSSKKTSSSKS
jgi:hypothetical protein